MINILESLLADVLKNLIIGQIGLAIIIGVFLAFILKSFKQPLIPAYILGGIIIGPLIFGLIEDIHIINVLSEIGMAFLIFVAGLEIKFKKLKEVSKNSLLTGTFQIALLFLLGFFVSLLWGLQKTEAIYVGAAIAFSSTMVVLKILYDKKEINSLHGRLTIGILLIQDIAAILALTFLNTTFSFENLLISLGKASLFVMAAILLSKFSNPIFKKAAETPELLLLTAISFLFLFSIGAFAADLSIVIGAFFAGVALANSEYKTEIQSKISPIRDFFAVIFFVALGTQLTTISSSYLLFLPILLVLVVFVKPVIIMYLTRILGYKKRTSFFTANNLAQTSEFSLIIATLGLTFNHISKDLFSSLVLLTIITMSLTPYCINYEKRFYRLFRWILTPLNKIKTKEELEYFEEKGKRIILFGCHRMGSLLLKEFEKEKKDILVVDYNPEIIRSLIEKKIPCIYGDFISDEVLDRVNIKESELIISTIPDVDDNLILIKKARTVNPEIPIFVAARRISEALTLYEAGANYVIIPQIIGGKAGFDIIKKIKSGKIDLKTLKKEHIKYLHSIHHILY